jgi:glutamate dehydrogenase/leucine dehydrogenase
MARAGFRVVGIVDETQGLVRPGGLSVDEVESLLLRRRGNTLPPGDDARGAKMDREAFWETPADLFVAAAASGTLDRPSLDALEAAGVRFLVTGANHPFWAREPGDTEVERDADARFAIAADVIAGCGTAHAFACQSRSDAPLEPGSVFESIRLTVDAAVDEAVRRAGRPDCGLLAGALALALERCARREREDGSLPPYPCEPDPA